MYFICINHAFLQSFLLFVGGVFPVAALRYHLRTKGVALPIPDSDQVIFDRPQTDGQAINCLQSLIAFRQQILNIVAPCLISQTAVQCIMAYEFLFGYRHRVFLLACKVTIKK